MQRPRVRRAHRAPPVRFDHHARPARMVYEQVRMYMYRKRIFLQSCGVETGHARACVCMWRRTRVCGLFCWPAVGHLSTHPGVCCRTKKWPNDQRPVLRHYRRQQPSEPRLRLRAANRPATRPMQNSCMRTCQRPSHRSIASRARQKSAWRVSSSLFRSKSTSVSR